MRLSLLNIATVAATALAVAVAVVRFFDLMPPKSAETLFAPRRIVEWETYAVHGVRMGPAQAPVTVVEFCDFQCPHCRAAANTLSELRQTHPLTVAVIYRHYPLQELSLQAAIAAECGNRIGAFELLHDHIFQQRDSLGMRPWTELASAAGIRDTLQFAACLRDADSTVFFAVLRDVHAADRLGVTGTPTLLINDELYRGSPDIEYLHSLVEKIAASNR